MTTAAADDDARRRWNERYRSGDVPVEPSRFLTERAELLPDHGRALDVAGGAGRNACWLAQRGLDATLVDVSDAAVVAAARRARETGVDLTVVRLHLDRDPLPVGPWDVVVVHHFLHRGVWRAAAGQLADGGLLFLCQATVRNLERHPRPPRPWLLEEGELATLVGGFGDVTVVELDEGWTDEGRHEARAVLRRGQPPSSSERGIGT